jgi:Peptidase M15
MLSSKRSLAPALVALGLLAARGAHASAGPLAPTATGAGAPTPAPRVEAGSLLDQPPKVFTFKLDDPAASKLILLETFHEPALARPASLRRYLSGTFGRWRAEPWWALAWRPSDVGRGSAFAALSELDPKPSSAELSGDEGAIDPVLLHDGSERLFGFEPRDVERGSSALFLAHVPPTWLRRLDPAWSAPVFASTGATFASNGFDALWSLPPSKPVPNWRCRRRPVRFVRYGGESDAFPLVHCDGTVALQALDRLTLMARVPDAPRPGELLPDEPDPEAVARGEWVTGARLVHPRLLWALQRVADAFPWRTVYVYSGYRPSAVVKGPRSGAHHSMHSEARAMDISVMGIPNAALFQFCRTLDDVGCGFYPNSKFVHVDVRRPGTGHAFWIDASGPGEPSRYVDAWPGVVESGALVWDPD